MAAVIGRVTSRTGCAGARITAPSPASRPCRSSAAESGHRRWQRACARKPRGNSSARNTCWPRAGRCILSLRAITHSMVLWGPPGIGTRRRSRASRPRRARHSHHALRGRRRGSRTSARRWSARAERATGRAATVLFLDEVHRFNKAQQDTFLPFVEDGTLVFIGATTENPSFELNSALLSRARVYVLKALLPAELKPLVERALADPVRGLGASGTAIDAEALTLLAEAADGEHAGLSTCRRAADSQTMPRRAPAHARARARGERRRSSAVRQERGQSMTDLGVHRWCATAIRMPRSWLCRMLTAVRSGSSRGGSREGERGHRQCDRARSRCRCGLGKLRRLGSRR